MRRRAASSVGFTIIELLFITSIVGILSGLVMATFKELHVKAGVAVSSQAIRDARLAFSAAMIQPEDHTQGISYPQDSPGELQNATARELLPGFRVPTNTEFRVVYAPSCTGGGELSFIVAKHCRSLKYITWTRFCDGSEIIAEVPGSETQCPA